MVAAGHLRQLGSVLLRHQQLVQPQERRRQGAAGVARGPLRRPQQLRRLRRMLNRVAQLADDMASESGWKWHLDHNQEPATTMPIPCSSCTSRGLSVGCLRMPASLCRV